MPFVYIDCYDLKIIFGNYAYYSPHKTIFGIILRINDQAASQTLHKYNPYIPDFQQIAMFHIYFRYSYKPNIGTPVCFERVYFVLLGGNICICIDVFRSLIAL